MANDTACQTGGEEVVTDLVLGVVDVPYENEGKPRDPKRARITKKGRVHSTDAQRIQNWMEGRGSDSDSAVTTVQVATWLEEKYHVMEVFYEEHKDDITQTLIDSIGGALENLYAGAPAGDPFAEAEQQVTADFRTFLLTGEIETLGLEGVPTQAALERRSLRFKRGRSGTPRPSFIDTSTYELAMRCWTE